MKLIHEFGAKDTIGDENEFWEEFPLIVQTDNQDSIFFLIGSKHVLEEGALYSEFSIPTFESMGSGKFLYPEQYCDFIFNKTIYKFRAFEEVILNKNNENGYEKKYQIEMEISTNNGTKGYNLSKQLGLQRSAAKHCIYQTPILIFVGDINKDGFLDFIYYSHTMIESCESSEEFHLFISDKSNLQKPIKKVANTIKWNCIT